MALLSAQDLAFIFGLLGNIVSFLVFLAPVPTFHTILKKKSSEGFQAIPYVVALFSASLLLFYAFLKKNAMMIVSINGIGCVIEVTYLFMYLLYAPKSLKLETLKLIGVVNVGAQGLVIVCSFLFAKGPGRVTLVGWICAAVNLAVFAAPLSIMKRVITTKSVEFMPFTLSFFLTLSATMWFFYGFFISDYYIALPNVIGFLLGMAQMALYMVYKNANKDEKWNSKLEGGGNKEAKKDNVETTVFKEPKKDVEMGFKLQGSNDETNQEKPMSPPLGKQGNHQA